MVSTMYEWVVQTLICDHYMDVSKNMGKIPPKMDGETKGKPYFLMDDLGVPLFLETPI